MIDSFTKFIQGKLINNKKVEMIIDSLNTVWNYNVGYSSVGYFGDNEGEFANIKLDELTSKIGLMVKFGPVYSPWSNGINERNPASTDITIQILMEDKKTLLTDALVKMVAWTHNTSVNIQGCSPL